MQSHILDIIFEKRNKLYGAYTLRKFYNNRLIKSLGITLGAAIILCAFTFMPEKKLIIEPDIDFISCPIGKIQPQEPKKPLTKQKIKSIQSSQKKFTSPIITDSTNESDFLQNIKTTDLTGSINIALENADETVIIGGKYIGVENGSEGKKEIAPAIDATVPVENPEIEPSYPGGINALTKFLQKNLNNPSDMAEGEMVSVNVRFVVGYDGKLQKFTVVKDGGAIFNNEVIRVLKKMPEWIPGKSKGQNVAVYFTIPVKFVTAD